MKKFFALTAFVLAASLVAFPLFAGGKKEQVVIRSVEDLAGKRIGVQTGTTGETYVIENVEDAKLSSFKSAIDAALDLKNGLLDAVVIDYLPAKEIAARNPSLMIVSADFASEEYAIAVKKGNSELLGKINATIANMKANGEYEALCNAFIPADGQVVVPASLKLTGNGILKMGTNAAFPPFEYVDGKDIVGFDITMAEFIARDAGMSLLVIDMAFDSLIPALQAGTIDMAIAGMSVTEERQKNVDFSEPYYSSQQAILVRK